MQDGSRDDWIRWLQTSNDASNGERLLTVLTSMAPDEIGIALVSATKSSQPM